MNRNRIIVGLASAVVIALLLSMYVYRTFKRVTNVKVPQTKHIVVADRPLQLGTRLEAGNLRVISWPDDDPIAGSFPQIENCVGRAVITPVAENEPILESKLAPKEAGA